MKGEHATLAMALMLVALLIPVWFEMRRAKNKGASGYIRRIPGVDAIDEAVGRSAEMGKPSLFSFGLTDIGPTLYACLSVAKYIARKTAEFKGKLFLPQCTPETLAITEGVIREAYEEAGKGNSFDPDTILFLSGEQFAYASGYMGLIHREKAASTFLFGEFKAESLLLAEAGQQVEAFQVAASISPEQTPFFISTCDYTLIGEELYAAAAYLSKDPVQVGTLRGQDWGKLSILILIIFGVVISTLFEISGSESTFSLETLFTSSSTILEDIKILISRLI